MGFLISIVVGIALVWLFGGLRVTLVPAPADAPWDSIAESAHRATFDAVEAATADATTAAYSGARANAHEALNK